MVLVESVYAFCRLTSRYGGLEVGEVAKAPVLTVNLNTGAPFPSTFIPVYSSSATIIITLSRPVPTIVFPTHQPQILDTVIRTHLVDMVNLHTFDNWAVVHFPYDSMYIEILAANPNL